MIAKISQNPREPGFVQNPYPFYDVAREKGSFFHWEEFGIPCATSYEVVNGILRDRRFGREAPEGFEPQHPDHLKPFYDFERHSILEREPPTHTRIRGLLVRAFTSKSIAAFESDIDRVANSLIDGFDGGEIDLLAKFCERIPIIIISRLMGMDEAMSDQFISWSHDMVAMYQARRDRTIEDTAVKATQNFSDYIRGCISERQKSPKDDLISRLIAARDDGDKLSTDELVTTCILLLNAGHEATVHSFANAIKVLLETQQDPNICFADEKSTLLTVDETLRYEPPLHMFTRHVMEDVEVFGNTFKKGEQIGLVLGAANRDPQKYHDPHRFDITRKAASHVSFGAGLHFCIGAPLAKLEMAVALPILFKRIPNLRIKTPPLFADRYHFHGLENLICEY